MKLLTDKQIKFVWDFMKRNGIDLVSREDSSWKNIKLIDGNWFMQKLEEEQEEESRIINEKTGERQ